MGATCGRMDKSLGKDNKTPEDQFFNKLKYYTTQDRHPYGEVKVYQYKENFIVKLEEPFVSKIEMENRIRLMKILAQEDHHSPTIFRMHAQKQINCQSNYLFTCYASLYTYTLREYLLKNQKKGLMLDAGQVWYLMKSLAELGRFLQGQKVVIRRIHSTALWISPAYHIKIGIEDLALQKNGLITSKHELGILSPEEMENSKYSISKSTKNSQNSVEINKYSVIDPYKSRVFSLGMLILECYTGLDSIINYYNYTQRAIDVLTLNSDIKQILDTPLASLLSRMLQVNPKKRIDFISLCELISMSEKYVTISDSLKVN